MQSCSWEDIIPVEETESAVQFLVETWNLIVQRQPDFIQFKISEPKLTERLCFYLRKLQANSGLTGFWDNEAQYALYDERGELHDRIRKDIKYSSNKFEQRLELFFEFKKIRKTTLSAYRGENGMCRFVDGNYAINAPFAIMIGIIKNEDDGIINQLYETLLNNKLHDTLKMIPNIGGEYVWYPSEVIPGFAKFETQHLRAPEKAPQKGCITIAHIILMCHK